MSTRSAIVLRLPKGSYAGIYCHFDGYPGGVGATLAEHYTDAEKVRQLIELGDISVLGERVEPDPSKPHRFGDAQDGVTVAYMRDRGEKECEANVSTSLMEVLDSIDHQYAYVYENGAWTCDGVPLAQAIAQAVAEEE